MVLERTRRFLGAGAILLGLGGDVYLSKYSPTPNFPEHSRELGRLYDLQLELNNITALDLLDTQKEEQLKKDYKELSDFKANASLVAEDVSFREAVDQWENKKNYNWTSEIFCAVLALVGFGSLCSSFMPEPRERDRYGNRLVQEKPTADGSA